MVIYMLCGTEPCIPVFWRHVLRHSWLFSWNRNSLWPYRTVSPNVYGVNGTDQSFIKPIHCNFLHWIRRSLVSHLSNHFIFPCSFRKEAGFGNGVGHRFLNIHMFTHRHTGKGSICMEVIWC